MSTVTYRVGVGETCRSIAKKFYGDEGQWERVYDANKWRLENDVQTSSDKLFPGTELTIRSPRFSGDAQPVA
ncbi:MAG: LysM peptidoglycan-binding domain-containing protein [Chloroflexi bacterium]|nr:LysM peptidoglycan-binding domain-containing protein [Chloroflexota bacterium]